MDLSQFNTRAASEAGRILRLRHPFTGELLGTDDNFPAFCIRGFASPTAQTRFNTLLLEREQEGENTTDPTKLGFEGAHQAMIENALPYIISAENIEVDGK